MVIGQQWYKTILETVKFTIMGLVITLFIKMKLLPLIKVIELMMNINKELESLPLSKYPLNYKKL